jgi:hypothetical protein
MSVEIKARVMCDGCGDIIEGKPATQTTTGMQAYWDCKKQMGERRWIQATRYGKAKHYCQKCADCAPKLAMSDRLERKYD